LAQRIAIVAELKRILKERGMTYADVARKLSLSHASVKRLFAAGDFSLERVDRICELTGLEMTEVMHRVRTRETPVTRLTLAQEREIVSDPRLFLITWLVLNNWRFKEIVSAYKFSERETLRYLIRLDRLKIIELLPGNRTRLRVTRNLSWQAGGPMQRYLHQRLLKEFFASDFAEPRAELCFYGGIMSEAVLAQVKRIIKNALKECVELSEHDAQLPLSARTGAAYVLALRPWQYSGFDAHLRHADPSTT
jgi:transcriptional regulator with XRE-family HTH domain